MEKTKHITDVVSRERTEWKQAYIEAYVKSTGRKIEDLCIHESMWTSVKLGKITIQYSIELKRHDKTSEK